MELGYQKLLKDKLHQIARYQMLFLGETEDEYSN